MNALFPQIAALLGFEIEAITDRAKRLTVAYGIIGLFGVIAFVFLLVAGFLALADWLGPIYAALILAGSFLLLALATFLGTRIGEGERRRREAERRRANQTSAAVTTAAMTALPVVMSSPTARIIALPVVALGVYYLLRGGSTPPKRD
ncbi:hypothetical protein [Devosia limi]|uniref:Holin-X, holin superfamily III n=1 Tax=Devosia limi DSM 17137 TaxID=1121477 RepID=A0A1M4WP47_9HYPH|nr:hypothetical protein [Devosia limi]SHE82978.1 hypothetical protein SAMN02745223_01157 [Devosia limi DSM 17137]